MRFEVKYKVDATTTSIILNLQGGTESEAKEKMYSQYTVPRNKQIIILSIRPV